MANGAPPPYTGAGNPSEAAVLAAGGMAGQVNQQPVAQQQLVYMGPGFAGKKPIRPAALTGALNKLYNADQLGSLAQHDSDVSWGQTMWGTENAKLYWWQMDPEKKAQIQKYVDGRYGYPVKSNVTVQSEWNNLVDTASNMSLSTNKLVSPWDLMDAANQGAQSYGGSGGGGGGAYAGPVSRVTLSSPSDAKVLVDQMLQNYLGRDAKPKEFDKFLTMLNKAQAANPDVATPHGPGMTVQQTGLNPQEAAKEFALSRPDAAEYTANSQYMDWLLAKVSADPTEGMASGL